METVVSLIQSVGFPIAVAVAMFIMLQGEQKEHKAESQQIRDAVTDLKIEFTDTIHKLESQTTEAINNNTLVIQKLLDKLEEKTDGPAMAEGLDFYKGKIITLTESASNKYIFGKFFFANDIVSLDLDELAD